MDIGQGLIEICVHLSRPEDRETTVSFSKVMFKYKIPEIEHLWTDNRHI